MESLINDSLLEIFGSGEILKMILKICLTFVVSSKIWFGKLPRKPFLYEWMLFSAFRVCLWNIFVLWNLPNNITDDITNDIADRNYVQSNNVCSVCTKQFMFGLVIASKFLRMNKSQQNIVTDICRYNII